MRFQHAAMATVFEIRCAHPDATHARQAAQAAFEVVDRLELLFSRFIENSDIARINHLSAGDQTIVASETMECLRLASLIHAETGGAFDVSLGTGFENLELRPADFVVTTRAPSPPPSPPGPVPATGEPSPPGVGDALQPVQLDLGAIGKGFAVDRMAEVLEEWEVGQALIDAGRSSVLALEPPPAEDGWTLTLSEPIEHGTVLVTMRARQRALGASGIQKKDHIWNAREQAPVRARRAAWVSAPRGVLADISRQADVEPAAAAVADALSTAFMISAPEDIEAFCRKHRGLEAWILEAELAHFPATMPAGCG